jgi:phage baseplate assembly protein gpV
MSPYEESRQAASSSQPAKGSAQAKAAAKAEQLLATSATCVIRIDNKEIKNDVSSVKLEQYINQHHVLAIRIKQIGGSSSSSGIDDPSDYSGFLGKSISLNIKPQGGLVDSSKEMEFIGVVTKLGLDNSIDGVNTVLITASSPTIALDGARHNAFFHDMTASDVIGAILRKYPITLGSIESTTVTHKFTVQYRETDYEFIMRLAGESGKFAFYNGKEFRLVKASGNAPEDLTWRETLGAFTFGFGTGAYEFASQVYNYEQKKHYKQDTKSLPAQSALSALSKIAPDASQTIFSNSGFSIIPKTIGDSQSLDELLQSKKNGVLGQMIKCYGISIIPKVTVGSCVKVKGMDKLDGTFWVNYICHKFDESGQYSNSFDCTPLDMAFPTARYRRLPITDIQSAEVLDNNDPDKMGRIKVKFPWIDSDETIWVRFLSLHAGKDRGWYCLPEIGDEVLIAYENGNPDLPIALGALYNKVDLPPSSAVNADNNIKMFVTKGGNQICFKDDSGSEQIKISTKDGKNVIVMDMSGPKISIESKNGDISIKAKNVSIECDQKFEVKTQTDIDLKAQGNLNTEGSMNAKMKAGVNLQLEGTITQVKGNPIQLN